MLPVSRHPIQCPAISGCDSLWVPDAVGNGRLARGRPSLVRDAAHSSSHRGQNTTKTAPGTGPGRFRGSYGSQPARWPEKVTLGWQRLSGVPPVWQLTATFSCWPTGNVNGAIE